jgi:hypothetical protein
MRQKVAGLAEQTNERFRVNKKVAIWIMVLVVAGAMAWITAPVRSRALAGAPRFRSGEEVATIDVASALCATPEYRIMRRYGHDSDQHRILSRKARLRVTAAAQHVARDKGYGSVVCSPSSSLPDVTDRVISTIRTPNLSFDAVAQLSDRPFTGAVIPAVV